MEVLVLGDGLLGSEIIKQTGWDYLSHSKDGIDVVENIYGLFSKISKINQIRVSRHQARVLSEKAHI